MTGDSAGGNLAVALTVQCLERGLRPPDALVPVYPALLGRLIPSPSRLLSVMDPLLSVGALTACLAAYTGAKETNDPRVSPLFSDKETLKRFPRTRVIVGEMDPLMDESIEFVRQLLRLDVDADLTVLPALPHGFLGFNRVADDATAGTAAIIKALEECVKYVTENSTNPATMSSPVQVEYSAPSRAKKEDGESSTEDAPIWGGKWRTTELTVKLQGSAGEGKAELGAHKSRTLRVGSRTDETDGDDTPASFLPSLATESMDTDSELLSSTPLSPSAITQEMIPSSENSPIGHSLPFLNPPPKPARGGTRLSLKIQDNSDQTPENVIGIEFDSDAELDGSEDETKQE